MARFKIFYDAGGENDLVVVDIEKRGNSYKARSEGMARRMSESTKKAVVSLVKVYFRDILDVDFDDVDNFDRRIGRYLKELRGEQE